MNENILTVPIAISIILGMFTQLVDVAESSSDKIVKYSEDMENALDCAFAGIPIEKCSPNLVKTDFKQELNQTKEIVDEMRSYSEKSLEELELKE